MALGESSVLTPLAALVLSFLAVLAGTGRARAFLLRRDILDRPNERSSHKRPVPRGGGLALTPVLILGWAALALVQPMPAGLWGALAGAVLLFVVSFIDDLRGLGAPVRFGVQVLAVTLGLAALPEQALVFQGVLPPWADRLLAALAWLWFVNLYNFMDGIDGMTGTQTACISSGLILVAMLAATSAAVIAPAAAALGAALGFLWWNRHPARIFLGDAGSVPLGYLTGWLLLVLAAGGAWAAALILPGYYLADATVTLVRRGLRGERVWQAHREHFYQKALGRTPEKGHDRVIRRVLWGNVLLAACAIVSLDYPWLALPLAALVVVGILSGLHRMAQDD